MTSPRLWIVGETYESRNAYKEHSKEFKLLSAGEMSDAIRSFNLSLPGNAPWPHALPADFPRPVFRMPRGEAPLLAPDYFRLESWDFVSRRMREAMALPGWAVSYVPAEIETGSQLARSQDYALMHPRAFAEVIDPEASQCLVQTRVSAKTGDSVTRISGVSQLRFKAGIQVPCDLFCDSRDTVHLLAADSLAQRVLDAGCTGAEFRHPLWFQADYGNDIIRTREGMGHIQWDAEGQSYEIVPVSPEEADAGPQT